MVYGIVTAGGMGRRLGLKIPKLEVNLLGTPILMYALRAFQLADTIDSIIVVVPPGLVDAWSLPRLRAEGIEKALETIAGGDTRQDSVYGGLNSIPETSGVVVVHDGARPLVTGEMVEKVCVLPEGVDGLITGLPLSDTVKEVEGDMVKRTLERGRLVTVQTPQAFSTEVLREAHRSALEEGFLGTDDASLVERVGGVVKVVEGNTENIKVTFPVDLSRAESILMARRNR